MVTYNEWQTLTARATPDEQSRVENLQVMDAAVGVPIVTFCHICWISIDRAVTAEQSHL